MQTVRADRKPPTAIVPTRWGDVLVRAFGGRTEGVAVLCVQHPIPGKPYLLGTYQPIRVNGVEYLVSASLERIDGRWEQRGHFSLHRKTDKKSGTYRWEATWSAVKQVRDELADEVGKWLDSHRYFLHEAQRVRRNNELAELEGAVAGAEASLEKARAALAEALASDEDD